MTVGVRRSMIVRLVLLLGLVCAPGCNEKQYLHDPEWRTGEPILTILYNCDLSMAGQVGRPTAVLDGTKIALTTEANGLLYFRIDADFRGGEVDHKAMHFVLGGEKASGGKALVNGRFTMPKEDAAIVTLEQGWLWVSDKAPPNWAGLTDMPPGWRLPDPPNGAGGNTPESYSEWLAWNLTTLIRSRWTWAGSVMTKFVFRVEPNGGDDSVEFSTYSLDDETKSNFIYQAADGGKPTLEIGEGEFSTMTGKAPPGPVSSVPDGSDDKAFLNRVQCLVEWIKKNPTTESECGQAQQQCDP